jgi:YidC/Oxa1 family membrane protein insertase
MLHTILVQPLINLLVSVYALIPGHDFGFSIILFTIMIRFALLPLVKKQVRQQRAMKELQPEIAKIKAKAKGDKQQEALLVMELYKEREINPFASLGIVLIQLPILIALYAAIQTILKDGQIVAESYSFVRSLSHIEALAANPSLFDPTFLGIVHLSHTSLWLALAAAATQYVQTRQLMPRPKVRKKLRDVLRNSAKTGDNSEAMAAMTQGMGSFFTVLMFVAAATLPAAIALYWTTGNIIGVLQQHFILKRDVEQADQKNSTARVVVSAKRGPGATKKTSSRKKR